MIITNEHGTPQLDTVHHCRAETLLGNLVSNSVDLILTDPPYGVGTQVSARRSPDERFDEIFGADEINADWLPEAYRTLKQGGALYAFAKWLNVGDWKRVIESVGFDVRNCIIWDKMQHGTGDLFGAYAPQYEMILFAVKGSHKLRGKRPVDIIRYPKVQPQLLIHPYEKPTGLLEQLISSSSDRGDVVIDPFCGSGSTLKAALKQKRQYMGCDISDAYANMARNGLRMLAGDVSDLPMFTELLATAAS